jgi:hypothetical protein
VKGEREKLEPPVGAPSAAKTGAARGRSRTRRRRERLLPLLPLLARRRAAAFLFFLLAGKPHHHTTPTPALRPVATEVRTTASLLLWLPSHRAEVERTNAPRRHAAAGDAGLRARLGCSFLQVSLPSSTHAAFLA